MLAILLSCWAPEVDDTPAEPKPPIESASGVSGSSTPAPTAVGRKSSPLTPPSPEEERELQSNARVPPYSAWTTRPETSVIGPNGGAIFSITESGKRVEVIRVVPQYAQIICSGCAPPKQNQAGWINIEHISMEWDLPEGDPLIFMLNKRKKWLKSQEDPPEALSNKTDICMLVDNGFRKVRDEYHWSIQDGHIHVAPDGDTWKITSAKKPSSPASSTWRCDIQYPRTEGTP